MQQQVNQLISLVAGGVMGIKHLANQKAQTAAIKEQGNSMDRMINLNKQMTSDPKYSKFYDAFKEAMGDKWNDETINQEMRDKVKEMVKKYSSQGGK